MVTINGENSEIASSGKTEDFIGHATGRYSNNFILCFTHITGRYSNNFILCFTHKTNDNHFSSSSGDDRATAC